MDLAVISRLCPGSCWRAEGHAGGRGYIPEGRARDLAGLCVCVCGPVGEQRIMLDGTGTSQGIMLEGTATSRMVEQWT